MIGDSVVGVIAQRLGRRLCPDCKRPVQATEDEKRLLGVDINQPLTIYEPGTECSTCGGVGYFGRIGVYEIMPVNNELRIKIAAGARADELKAQAVADGMHTLKDSGVRLCLEGTTSFKEALKIAYESD